MNEHKIKTKIKKKELLLALEKTMGVVTPACKMVGISRMAFYKYLNKDQDFKKRVEEITEVAKDFAETKLYTLIANGSESAVFFYLKCKAKDRGYIEKVITQHESELAGGVNINMVVTKDV
jgi:hypothetical protein